MANNKKMVEAAAYLRRTLQNGTPTSLKKLSLLTIRA